MSRAPGRRKARPGDTGEKPNVEFPLLSHERLAPARGVLIGLVIAAAIWALLGFAVLVWRGLF